MSLLSFVVIYLMGNKTIWGPIAGIFAQIPWITYYICTKQYGLIPGAVVAMAFYGRAWYLWSRHNEETSASAVIQA